MDYPVNSTIKHAFSPIASANSRILLLGTMPGEQSLKMQQYYAHKGNQFWKLLFHLFKQPFSTNYATQQQLLLKNGIALWDVLQNCERVGSSDNSIKNATPNNFKVFYNTYPTIKHVFFTATKAQMLYNNLIKEQFDLQFHLLPSPSGANARKTFEEKLVEWQQILLFTNSV